MSLSIKILDMNYLNQDINETISLDNPIKNIDDLNISIINTNSLCIKWNDSRDPNWQKNIIVKASSCIPTSVFTDKVIETTYTKNQYSITGLLDNNLVANTLYCYRIFTQFADMDEYYSGFKNIFFVYVFNDDNTSIPSDNMVINASEILLDSMHQFVTDEQINKWNNNNISSIDLNIITTDSTHRFVTDEQINKWDNINISNINPSSINTDYMHQFVTQNQINKWDNNNISNIDSNTIITDSTHRFVTDEQINKWDSINISNINLSTLTTDSTHRFVTDDQINKWDNINISNIDPNIIITDSTHQFVTQDQIDKWNNNTSQGPTTISANNVVINNSLGDNFNPNNVEDALKQLFTFVVNGKNLLASAINDKLGNIEATNQMTFEQLAQYITTIDEVYRQNLILIVNNKFDLNIPSDYTFDKISTIINNITLDSMRKTITIESVMDFPELDFEFNINLLSNTIHLNGELNIDGIVDFSGFSMEVQ